MWIWTVSRPLHIASCIPEEGIPARWEGAAAHNCGPSGLKFKITWYYMLHITTCYIVLNVCVTFYAKRWWIMYVVRFVWRFIDISCQISVFLVEIPPPRMTSCMLQPYVAYLWHTLLLCVVFLWQTLILCVSYLWHMLLLCVSYLSHMLLLCVDDIWHMFMICLSYLWHMADVTTLYTATGLIFKVGGWWGAYNYFVLISSLHITG